MSSISAEETAAHYDSLTPIEKEEDASWAAGAARAARRLRIDEDEPASRRLVGGSRRPPRRR